MNIPSNFLLIAIFILWLQYEINKTNRQSNRQRERFWNKERNANLTRPKDISHLDYITIPVDSLPMADHADDTINSYRDIILALTDEKILNLTGTTNTQLKQQYGVANLPLLSAYDNNYTRLVSMLQKWAESLYAKGYVSDAVCVLEFAVTCHTDVHKTYTLLAAIYKKQNTPDKINDLINDICGIDLHGKDSLLSKLKQIHLSGQDRVQ